MICHIQFIIYYTCFKKNATGTLVAVQAYVLECTLFCTTPYPTRISKDLYELSTLSVTGYYGVCLCRNIRGSFLSSSHHTLPGNFSEFSKTFIALPESSIRSTRTSYPAKHNLDFLYNPDITRTRVS